MTMMSASTTATAAAPLPLGSNPEPAAAILTAASQLLPHLERGERIDAATLRAAMETAFGTSDATGAWDWKTAYDACEAATVLFLRKYGRALFRKAGTPAARLSALTKIGGLLPAHTRRSAESQTFQQFSTPIPLGLVAACAAAITPADRVLEPSAGTGLLATLAEVAGGALVLNELAEIRAREAKNVIPYGSARWAEPGEIRAAGLLGADGVVLGRYERDYLRHDGPEHVLCFAPTRSGKGVGLVVPTLLTWPGSTIIHDIEGENWGLRGSTLLHLRAQRAQIFGQALVQQPLAEQGENITLEDRSTHGAVAVRHPRFLKPAFPELAKALRLLEAALLALLLLRRRTALGNGTPGIYQFFARSGERQAGRAIAA